MTPIASLSFSAVACVVTAVVGLVMVIWAVAPHHGGQMRNMRYLAAMLALILSVTGLFIAAPRYPFAFWALLLWSDDAKNASYSVVLLVGLVGDLLVCAFALVEAWSLGGDEVVIN
jgi:hypothetical protein